MSDVPRTPEQILETGAGWISEAELEMLVTDLAAMSAQRDSIYSGLHALFDAANLFTKFSVDSGQTWQNYPIERRIALAIAVCKDEAEWESRALAAEARALASEKDAERLRGGLQWYADREHLMLNDEWESEEGWMCPPNDESWMVEDGGVARLILKGKMINPDRSADEIVIDAIRARA